MAHTLSPLEQEVLDEYTRLLNNMDQVPIPSYPRTTPSNNATDTVSQLSASIASLATSPTAKLLDSLRELERKTGLVFTLLKASVYSIVLQQQLEDEGQMGGGGVGGENVGREEGSEGGDQRGGDEYEAGY